MNKQFEMLEVSRSLGVAPSTAGIIAGLLSGTVNPDNFRSVEFWFASTFGAPPKYQKVLAAVAELLNLDKDDVRVTMDVDDNEVWYLAGFAGQPTVAWFGDHFTLMEMEL